MEVTEVSYIEWLVWCVKWRMVEFITLQPVAPER